jgi:hypothetical protein
MPKTSSSGLRYRSAAPIQLSAVATAWFLGLGLAIPLAAQFGQYTTAGAIPGAGTIADTTGGDVEEDVIDAVLESARWRFGPLRVAPFFGLRQSTLHTNVFATPEDSGVEVSDLSAALGAGFTGYLPTGSDVLWTLEVKPEISLWRDQDERNEVVGHYGLGVIALFNRLQFSIAATSLEDQTVVTPELPQSVTDLRQALNANIAVRLSSRLSLALSAVRTEIESRSALEDDPRVPDYSVLDRRELRQRGGLTWAMPNDLELGLYYELGESELAAGARNLSSESSGPVLRFSGEGNRLGFEIEVSRRDFEPTGASVFPETEEIGATLEVDLEATDRWTIGLHGTRSELLALDADYAFLTYQRFGIENTISLGRELSLHLFARVGDDRYHAVGELASERRDDELSWGFDLEVPLPQAFPDAMNLRLGWNESRIDSNQDGFDRSFGGPSLGFAFDIGGRLRWE